MIDHQAKADLLEKIEQSIKDESLDSIVELVAFGWDEAFNLGVEKGVAVKKIHIINASDYEEAKGFADAIINGRATIE
jgi:hypothetical protein